MYRSAVLSDDLKMRWLFECIWNPSPAQRICVFVLLNPSTATAEVKDPTSERCIEFARYWGYDGMRIVNLVGFRATKPPHMYAWFIQQSSADLVEHCQRVTFACQEPDVAKVVLGFGKVHAYMKSHANRVMSGIQKHRNLHCISMNQDGSPTHPLYLKGTLTPRLYLP